MESCPEVREAARKACTRYRLDVCDAPLVEEMLDRPESCWEPCCNSGCRPCMDDYADAARYLRELLQPATESPRPREE